MFTSKCLVSRSAWGNFQWTLRFSSLDDLHASTLGSMVTNKGNRLGEVFPGIPVTPTTAGRTHTVNTPASLSVSTECQMAKIKTCVWKPEGYSTGIGDDSESYRGRRRLVFKKDDRNMDEASERAESRRGWALCFQQQDKHYWWSCMRTGRTLLLQNKRLPKDRKCHLPQMQLWNITY